VDVGVTGLRVAGGSEAVGTGGGSVFFTTGAFISPPAGAGCTVPRLGIADAVSATAFLLRLTAGAVFLLRFTTGSVLTAGTLPASGIADVSAGSLSLALAGAFLRRVFLVSALFSSPVGSMPSAAGVAAVPFTDTVGTAGVLAPFFVREAGAFGVFATVASGSGGLTLLAGAPIAENAAHNIRTAQVTPRICRLLKKG
jgi:hypothetical protein